MSNRRAHLLAGWTCLLTLMFYVGDAHGQADTTVRSIEPTEVYGDAGAPIRLRLGNGGAGPTGLLRALAEDYIAQTGHRFAIAWYQNITRLTLQNLREGIIDVALTYEPESEQLAIQEGWASAHLPVFNDHFLIVGPQDNPAHVTPDDTAEQAFSKIAQLATQRRVPVGAVFLSRDDHSGTNDRELALWQAAAVNAWRDASSDWYFRYHVFPAEALKRADKEGLYTLTDHGTWLSIQRELHNSHIFVQGGAQLLNPCHALLSDHPTAAALDFRAYLAGRRAQTLIANFGCAQYNGRPLFTPAGQQEFVWLQRERGGVTAGELPRSTDL